MGLLKNLFGTKKTEDQKKGGSSKTRDIISQSENGPRIKIDPKAITHAFVVLTHSDIQHSDDAANRIPQLNKHCQPDIWNISFKAKFVTFTAPPAENGFPDVGAIPVALEENGLTIESSIVINDLVVSFDGGRTQSKIYAGFALHDRSPRFILPRTNGCIPA